jgi:hypothetical protein
MSNQAGKGDRNRTANWKAWRESPLWDKTKDRDGVINAQNGASDASHRESGISCPATPAAAGGAVKKLD